MQKTTYFFGNFMFGIFFDFIIFALKNRLYI